MIKTATLSLLFVPLLASAAAAQGKSPSICWSVLSKAKQGATASYLTNKVGAPPTEASQIVFTVTARTETELTLEVFTKTPQGWIIMETVYGLTGAQEGVPLRGALQLMNRPKMVTPIHGGKLPAQCEGDEVGSETLPTAKAGSFTTRHLKRNNVDGSVDELWLSDDVSPTGFVKSVTGANQTMTMLRAVAANGKSAFH